ncbi:helix-turn-helix domain-containing protein [Streptomyces diacarni]|uniref:LexA family protein n=1 Tax=Streptomyces diacarni TaxID=2800381 RepID=UPI003409504E
MARELSDAQLRVLDCLRAWIATHGEAPTLREIAEQLGIGVPTVHHHLRRLTEEGLASRTGGWRGYRPR